MPRYRVVWLLVVCLATDAIAQEPSRAFAAGSGKDVASPIVLPERLDLDTALRLAREHGLDLRWLVPSISSTSMTWRPIGPPSISSNRQWEDRFNEQARSIAAA